MGAGFDHHLLYKCLSYWGQTFQEDGSVVMRLLVGAWVRYRKVLLRLGSWVMLLSFTSVVRSSFWNSALDLLCVVVAEGTWFPGVLMSKCTCSSKFECLEWNQMKKITYWKLRKYLGWWVFSKTLGVRKNDLNLHLMREGQSQVRWRWLGMRWICGLLFGELEGQS